MGSNTCHYPDWGFQNGLIPFKIETTKTKDQRNMCYAIIRVLVACVRVWIAKHCWQLWRLSEATTIWLSCDCSWDYERLPLQSRLTTILWLYYNWWMTPYDCYTIKNLSISFYISHMVCLAFYYPNSIKILSFHPFLFIH